jgi:hypothetical protein
MKRPETSLVVCPLFFVGASIAERGCALPESLSAEKSVGLMLKL